MTTRPSTLPGAVTPGARGPWGVPGSAACLDSRGEGTVRGALSAAPPVPPRALRRTRVDAGPVIFMAAALAGLAGLAADAIGSGLAAWVVGW